MTVRQCVLIEPEVFDQSDEEGTVVLLQEHSPAQLGDIVRQLATLCPALAIRLDES